MTATGAPLEPPSLQHIFGTDELGRDMLNLTVHGARVSMSIGLLATVITIFVGALIGIVSGFVGGRIDGGLMRLTDFFLVLPTFVLAIILAPVILDIIGVEAEIFGLRATLIVIVDRHRHHVVGDDRPDHPLPDAVDPRAHVRGPGPGHRQRARRTSCGGTSSRTS